MKTLLITHTDLDGISPIILLNLTGIDFDYKSIDIKDIDETFDELLNTNINEYEQIYVTDLSLTEHVYELIDTNKLNVLVFDHHETHLFATIHPYVTVLINLHDRQTCGTEIFYEFLKEKYKELDKPIIKQYVDLVRQLDTFNFESNIPKQLDSLISTYGKKEFIKTMTKRLKKDKDNFEFTAFEKRYVKLKELEKERYNIKKEEKMLTYEINQKKCGIVFAETNKSELGNYLSDNHPELDLIIIFDASGGVSYRTSRNDVKVNDFASIYGGGGHPKASGSRINDEDRHQIIEAYFKDIKKIEIEKAE